MEDKHKGQPLTEFSNKSLEDDEVSEKNTVGHELACFEHITKLVGCQLRDSTESWWACNKYHIADQNNKTILRLEEEESQPAIVRALCSSNRPFFMSVVDCSTKEKILELERLMRCCSPIFCPWSRSTMIIRDKRAQILGYVKHAARETCMSWFGPSLYYEVADAEFNLKFYIMGPGGCVVECMKPNGFKVMTPGSCDQVGEIFHDWRGCCGGSFSFLLSHEADHFTLKVDVQLPVRDKALLFGALMLAVFLHGYQIHACSAEQKKDRFKTISIRKLTEKSHYLSIPSLPHLPCPLPRFLQESLPAVIRINVGGVHYETLLATLRSGESMLSSMFSGKHKLERDRDGCPFIDRPGETFGFILNYLRDSSMLPPKDVAMQVYTEALYYQIPTLIKKLESTPEVFRCRLRNAAKENLRNFEELKQTIIEKAQKKSEESLTLDTKVNIIASSDKTKLEEQSECIVNEHLLSISGANSRQETFEQTKRRLEMADMIIDDGQNFDVKLFIDTVEKELQRDGYNCKIWVENLKCIFKSNYTKRECRFQIEEYIAEFKWE